MKRLVSFTALALALGLGFASAQNITRSIQGAQDPRGPVGWDTSNAMYFPGHINAFGQTPATSLPTTTPGCGSTGGLNLGSTDAAGTVGAAVSGSTGCELLFGSPFNAPPACIATQTGTTTSNAAITANTTTTMVSFFGTTSGTSFSYVCIGNK